MKICIIVGINVAEVRRASGWSQEELAFRSGLHRTYISGIERGHRNPTLTVLERLADALGVSTGYLVNNQNHTVDIDSI